MLKTPSPYRIINSVCSIPKLSPALFNPEVFSPEVFSRATFSRTLAFFRLAFFLVILFSSLPHSVCSAQNPSKAKTRIALETKQAACPTVSDIFDTNGDGKLRMLFFGDSITYGIGDPQKIGFVGRMKRYIPKARIFNEGKPGEFAIYGASRLRSLLPERINLDYIFILEGINDYYYLASTPETTAQIVKQMSEDAQEATGAEVFVSTLLETEREYQQGWVEQVNWGLNDFARLDYNSLGSLVGHDDLHPSARGYRTMAHYLLKTLQEFTRKRCRAYRAAIKIHKNGVRNQGTKKSRQVR